MLRRFATVLTSLSLVLLAGCAWEDLGAVIVKYLNGVD